MELEEYTDPTNPYTPRPKASQEVARVHRQRDTEPLTPVAMPSPVRYPVPLGVAALLLVLLMIGMASWQLAKMPTKPLQVGPTPVATSKPTDVTSALVSAPVDASTEMPAPRTIDAYAAPDGLLLGPIELDREIIPVAHYGSGWMQADVRGSGRVWLRASDVPDVALIGPDLAPVAAAAPRAPQTMNVHPVPLPGAVDQPDVPPVAEPSTGQKEVPDRAAHHATAVARSQQSHGSK